MAFDNFEIMGRSSVGTTGGKIICMAFDGDDTYPAGGTVDFQQAMRDGFAEAEPSDRTKSFRIIGVSQGDCGAYQLGWTGPVGATNGDKLIVRQLSDGNEVAGDQSAQRYVVTLHIT